MLKFVQNGFNLGNSMEADPPTAGALSIDEQQLRLEVSTDAGADAVDSPHSPANEAAEDIDSTKKPSMMRIHADYRQSHSIDEAHWAQLLNEVCFYHRSPSIFADR